MKFTLILTYLFLLISPVVFAQKEANIWYFGQKAGLDFNNKSVINNVGVNAEEGSSVLCNSFGELLFYHYGKEVYNKKHQIMSNGSDIKGDIQTAQGSIIVPKVGAKNIYLLFTISEPEGRGILHYSEIDMNKEDGLGMVTIKNQVLYTNFLVEKLMAVNHTNQKDIWLISHEWLNNKFIAFLITDKGIDANPIVSETGSTHSGNKINAQGYLKISSDTKKIATVLEADHIVELCSFNNNNGKIQQLSKVSLPDNSYPYGVEFSPNSSFLYVSAAGTGKIYQYEVKDYSYDMLSTQYEIGKTKNSQWIGSLQLAPDGKIYFPIYNTNYLGAINEPNLSKENCKFQSEFVFLGNNSIARLGLPNFYSSYLNNIKPENSKWIFPIAPSTNTNQNTDNQSINKEYELKFSNDRTINYMFYVWEHKGQKYSELRFISTGKCQCNIIKIDANGRQVEQGFTFYRHDDRSQSIFGIGHDYPNPLKVALVAASAFSGTTSEYVDIDITPLLTIAKQEEQKRLQEIALKEAEEKRIREEAERQEALRKANLEARRKPNRNKALWKLGNQICCENDNGIYSGTIDQWNEDKSRVKIIIISGPSTTFEGQKSEKGTAIWVDPSKWHLCLEEDSKQSSDNDNSTPSQPTQKRSYTYNIKNVRYEGDVRMISVDVIDESTGNMVRNWIFAVSKLSDYFMIHNVRHDYHIDYIPTSNYIRSDNKKLLNGIITAYSLENAIDLTIKQNIKYYLLD